MILDYDLFLIYRPRIEASPFKGRINVPTARALTPPGSGHGMHPPGLTGHQMVYSNQAGTRSDFSLVPQTANYDMSGGRGFRSPVSSF